MRRTLHHQAMPTTTYRCPSCRAILDCDVALQGVALETACVACHYRLRFEGGAVLGVWPSGRALPVESLVLAPRRALFSSGRVGVAEVLWDLCRAKGVPLRRVDLPESERGKLQLLQECAQHLIELEELTGRIVTTRERLFLDRSRVRELQRKLARLDLDGYEARAVRLEQQAAAIHRQLLVTGLCLHHCWRDDKRIRFDIELLRFEMTTESAHPQAVAEVAERLAGLREVTAERTLMLSALADIETVLTGIDTVQGAAGDVRSAGERQHA